MKNLFTTITLFLSTLTVFAQDQTYNVSIFKNVEFPNIITIENENVKLNGHGMHTESISKLFVCGLYVYERTNDANEIIYDSHTKMIELVITSNQFQSNKTIKEIEKVHKENIELIKSGELQDMVSNIKKYEGIIPQNLISIDDRFLTYFKKANKGNTLEIENDIKTFLSAFEEEVKIGDHFRISCINEYVYIQKNGDAKIMIQSKEFQKSLLNIFIGNLAFDNSLKEDLLKKES